jgi:hypothetical protein
VLISTMGGGKQRMTVIVVKKDECSTSLDRRETSHQSSWDEHRGVDWFAVAIDVRSAVG